MAGAVDQGQVRRIARLARLELSADGLRLFADQLGEILTYFNKLAEADTEGVEPLAHPLPIGRQLMAPVFCEDVMLQAARLHERETDWQRRVPVVTE